MPDEPVVAEESTGPALVGSIAPQSFDEPLSAVESGYIKLAKADSDRLFGNCLSTIIKSHGYDSDDGRNYAFVEEQGKLSLRVSGK